MRFQIDFDLLNEASATLSNYANLFWLVGGAGSGKTTVCKTLSSQFGTAVYDMDAHIYGSYQSRFVPDRHPANDAWSQAPNGLAWLLDMSWAEFNRFHQAALVEYLDLLALDLANEAKETPLLIDGGVCHPSLLLEAVPLSHIVCLQAPDQASSDVWAASAERKAMKTVIMQLPNGERAWNRFLEFDQKISDNIAAECASNDIAILARRENESIESFTSRVAASFAR
jgi:hypothetical protein